jgi:hypothetical protein
MQSVVCNVTDGRESQRDGIVALFARRIVSITNAGWPVLLMAECRSFRARNLGGGGLPGVAFAARTYPRCNEYVQGVSGVMTPFFRIFVD